MPSFVHIVYIVMLMNQYDKITEIWTFTGILMTNQAKPMANCTEYVQLITVLNTEEDELQYNIFLQWFMQCYNSKYLCC